MQKVALIIALLALTQSPIQAQNYPSGLVVSIGDGDTLTVNQNGQKIKVRLGCVDAPEIKQSPYGKASRNRLKALLPIGSTVSIREIDRDRYGRTVAEIYKGNESINLAMVREGQSVIYRQYFDGCKATQKQFNQAESQAKQRKLGFWNQASPVMPWNFRKGKTTASPKPTTQPMTSGKNCDPSYPDLCVPPNSPDLDCKDISARRFRVLPPDPHKLDRDNDGVGCEK